MRKDLIKLTSFVFLILCALGIVLSSQSQPTTPNQLRVLTDANGYLAATAGSLTLPLSRPTQFSNTRLLTDSNGYLLVAVVNTNSTFTGDVETDCNTVTYDFTGRLTTGLNSLAANTWSLCGGATLGLSGNTTTVTSALPFSSAINYQLNGVLTLSATAPTIASGGCTTPVVTTNNGTAKFKVTLGTTCTGVKTFTLTMPTAGTGREYACDAVDLTTNATYAPAQSAAASATSVVITNYARTTGLAIDFADGEVLLVKCIGG